MKNNKWMLMGIICLLIAVLAIIYCKYVYYPHLIVNIKTNSNEHKTIKKLPKINITEIPNEQLIYFIVKKSESSFHPSTTKLYAFNPVDGKSKLIFSDEDTSIVLLGNTSISPCIDYSCSKNKIYAKATNRERYVPGHRDFLVELSQDGSNSYRVIIDPNKRNSPYRFFVNHLGTKLGYFIYEDDGPYMLHIYDLVNEKPLHSININQLFFDCYETSAGWLSDDRIILTMDTGDEHVTSEESYTKTGVYRINEDGTELSLLRKDFDKLNYVPDFIGELPDKTIVYKSTTYFEGDTAPTIYFENPFTKIYQSFVVEGLWHDLSKSGRYLAFVKDEKARELWYKDLVTGNDTLVFNLFNVSEGSGVSIVGWIQN